jgi:hypothetical protein
VPVRAPRNVGIKNLAGGEVDVGKVFAGATMPNLEKAFQPSVASFEE